MTTKENPPIQMYVTMYPNSSGSTCTSELVWLGGDEIVIFESMPDENPILWNIPL